jgi:glutathione S-transferase
MKLYYTKGACSLVVRIIMNELELPCEFESVDLKTKKTESGDDFLAINPKGAVPTLKLNNGEILTENAVILQYLADHASATSLLPAVGDLKRYRVLEWLNYITTELHKGFGPLFNGAIPQEVKEQVFIPVIEKKFASINAHLQQHQYLYGNHFTLPDAYLYVMVRWASSFKINLNERTHLTRYFDEISKRKSVEKSLKEEGLS